MDAPSAYSSGVVTIQTSAVIVHIPYALTERSYGQLEALDGSGAYARLELRNYAQLATVE